MKFVLLAFLAGCAGSTPLAHFEVTKSESDESCSTLADYCLRVTCTVKNDSPIPGQAVVDLQLLNRKGEVKHTQTERVELGPGDTKTVKHDFTEAKLLGKESKYACVIR